MGIDFFTLEDFQARESIGQYWKPRGYDDHGNIEQNDFRPFHSRLKSRSLAPLIRAVTQPYVIQYGLFSCAAMAIQVD
jgi:hypothetical protein